MSDPTNAPSKAVARTLGFEPWKRTFVDGFLTDLLRREVGARG
jgi:hypothetical protein